jgi:hypothetical protein
LLARSVVPLIAAPASANRRQDAMAWALRQIGCPDTYGGTGRCPGLLPGAHSHWVPPGPSWDRGGAWANVFQEGFSGHSLDSRWSDTWWAGRQYGQNPYYTACYEPGQVGESGGYLHMTLTHEPPDQRATCVLKGQRVSLPYAGAIADTYTGFHFGGTGIVAEEAKLRLPCTSRGEVIGWPAWWSHTNDWNGEIDVMEGGLIAAGRAGGTAANLHFPGEGPSGWDYPFPMCGWHDFGAQWDAGAQTVTFFSDGNQRGPPHYFPNGTPQYFMLDYQQFANGIAPPGGSATMLVAWVRAWQR